MRPPYDTAEAIYRDRDLSSLHAWVFKMTLCEIPDGMSTTTIIMVTPDGDVELRLALFNVYAVTAVCLFGANERSTRWLSGVRLERFLGPEVQDSLQLPSQKFTTMRSLTEFKDQIRRVLEKHLNIGNEKRLRYAKPDDRERIEQQMVAAQARHDARGTPSM